MCRSIRSKNGKAPRKCGAFRLSGVCCTAAFRCAEPGIHKHCDFERHRIPLALRVPSVALQRPFRLPCKAPTSLIFAQAGVPPPRPLACRTSPLRWGHYHHDNGSFYYFIIYIFFFYIYIDFSKISSRSMGVRTPPRSRGPPPGPPGSQQKRFATGALQGLIRGQRGASEGPKRDSVLLYRSQDRDRYPGGVYNVPVLC